MKISKCILLIALIITNQSIHAMNDAMSTLEKARKETAQREQISAMSSQQRAELSKNYTKKLKKDLIASNISNKKLNPIDVISTTIVKLKSNETFEGKILELNNAKGQSKIDTIVKIVARSEDRIPGQAFIKTTTGELRKSGIKYIIEVVPISYDTRSGEYSLKEREERNESDLKYIYKNVLEYTLSKDDIKVIAFPFSLGENYPSDVVARASMDAMFEYAHQQGMGGGYYDLGFFVRNPFSAIKQIYIIVPSTVAIPEGFKSQNVTLEFTYYSDENYFREPKVATRDT